MVRNLKLEEMLREVAICMSVHVLVEPVDSFHILHKVAFESHLYHLNDFPFQLFESVT